MYQFKTMNIVDVNRNGSLYLWRLAEGSRRFVQVELSKPYLRYRVLRFGPALQGKEYRYFYGKIFEINPNGMPSIKFNDCKAAEAKGFRFWTTWEVFKDEPPSPNIPGDVIIKDGDVTLI